FPFFLFQQSLVFFPQTEHCLAGFQQPDPFPERFVFILKLCGILKTNFHKNLCSIVSFLYLPKWYSESLPVPYKSFPTDHIPLPFLFPFSEVHGSLSLDPESSPPVPGFVFPGSAAYRPEPCIFVPGQCIPLLMYGLILHIDPSFQKSPATIEFMVIL